MGREPLGELGVSPPCARVEILGWHDQRLCEALGVGLDVARRDPAAVDRVAVEAQRGDEAALGMIGFEDLDVLGEKHARAGGGGDAVAAEDRTHTGR